MMGENNETINLIDSYSVCINKNINEIVRSIKTDITIVYFNDIFSTNDEILDMLENKLIKKVIIVSKNSKKINDKKLIFASKINANIIKKATKNIIIVSKPNDDYSFSKYIIKNIEKLFILSNKFKKNLEFNYLKRKIIALLYCNNSIYLNDILNALKVILLPTREKKNEFIYDTVCTYLDNEFKKCNICDFKNDQCVANRAGRCGKHTTMGCCYSFDYASIYEPRLVKNVKLCKYMKNKSCSTSNISCKLFTCTYLREKNIKFDTRKILLLDCFFNSKQHEVIRSNFFRSREEILNKLLEKNHDTYLWFYMFRKYAIKN